MKSRIQELDKATNRLNWQFIALYSSAFVALVMIVFLAIFLFVPSMDEISQRKSDMAALKKYPLQVVESDGKTLVRIMTKKCFSFESNRVKEKTFDWCQIDPKKY